MLGDLEKTITSLNYYVVELGGAVQLIGILRILIDPENMIPTANVSLTAYYINVCLSYVFTY